MMKGGVEDLSASKMGKIRNTKVVGRSYDQGVTSREFESIKANKYLDFKISEKIENARETFYKGEILYPSLKTVNKEILEELENDGFENIVKKIKIYKQTQSGDKEELTQNLVNALLEKELKWFILQRDQIGKISTQKKFEKYVSLVAQ